MLKIDGKWYHVDVTWDDPVWDILEGSGMNISCWSDAAIKEKEHYDWSGYDLRTGNTGIDSDKYRIISGENVNAAMWYRMATGIIWIV